MASITIRSLEPDVKERLRVRAARHGRSMEEEARGILREAVAQGVDDEQARDLASAIRALFLPFGGVKLQIPPREQMREPPEFSR